MKGLSSVHVKNSRQLVIERGSYALVACPMPSLAKARALNRANLVSTTKPLFYSILWWGGYAFG